MKNSTAQTTAPYAAPYKLAQKTALGLAISVVMSYPATLQALGLGELHSSSQLNQPLNAQIDLLSTNASEASKLNVRLASPEVFSRVGIDRPAFLDNLKFTPVVQNGKPIIKVTSTAPISETFLNFLLEVSWPQGQLLKEYTVLLDPPVLLNTGSAVADNSATVRAEPKPAAPARTENKGVIQRNQEAERQRQIQIRRQQQAQQANQNNFDQQQFEAQAQAVLAEKDKPVTHATGGTKYRVKRGDTVSRIASRLRYRGVSNSQMMVALFRANPHAFIKDNINYLKSGSLLTKPPKSEVTQYSASESRRIVRQHYAQWKKYRSGLAEHTVAQTPVKPGTNSNASGTVNQPAGSSDQAKLKVAGSGSDAPVSSSAGTAELQKELTLAQEALASSKSENAELRSRVTQLEAIIRKKERLITLKNDRLAKLEAQLSGTTKSGATKPETETAETANTDAEGKTDTTATTVKIPQPPINESDDLATQVANQDQQSNNRIIRTEDSSTTGASDSADQEVSPADVNTALSSADTDTESNADIGKQTEEAVAVSSPFVDQEKDSKDSILDLLSTPLVAAIGGGSLLALLLGWLLMRKSAKSADEEIEDAVSQDDEEDLLDDEFASADLDLDDDDDLESVAGSSSSADTLFSGDASDGENAIDSILSGDATIEEDEILQEADVYIVYGLHEQAEDELKKAISNHPEKLEYRYKLLENYKAANNPESFVSSAKEFLNAAAKHDEAGKAESLWEKIVAWGAEVAPENELFTDSSLKKGIAMVAGTAAAGAAVNVAKEAFSDELSDAADDAVANVQDSGLDLDIAGLDSNLDDELDSALSDTDFNLESELGLDDDLDLDDDFGLDELAGEIDSGDITADNVLSFGSPDAGNASTEVDTGIANLDLEIDQDSGLDKILPAGSGYTSDTDDSADDNLDDALSFLDLSDDDEEMQQAHISTKLDLARAYLDMGDVEGARHTLEEVVIEGNDDQKREAEELLQQTG